MSTLKEDLIEIGYVIKTHGYKGDLKVRLYENITINSKKPRAFFIYHKDEFLPFFTESLQYSADREALVHFEELDSKEAAAKFKSHTLFLKKEDCSLLVDTEEVNALIGYTIEDVDHGLIGIVENILTFPQQELLAVLYHGRQILIPLREELIHEMDETNKRIVFKLPEGFLDL